MGLRIVGVVFLNGERAEKIARSVTDMVLRCLQVLKQIVPTQRGHHQKWHDHCRHDPEEKFPIQLPGAFHRHVPHAAQH